MVQKDDCVDDFRIGKKDKKGFRKMNMTMMINLFAAMAAMGMWVRVNDNMR